LTSDLQGPRRASTTQIIFTDDLTRT